VFDLRKLDLQCVPERNEYSLPMLYVKVFVPEYNTLVHTSFILEQLALVLDVVCPRLVIGSV
jgi:hypothetical protein